MSLWSTKSDTDPKKLSPVEQARASMRKLSERGVEIPAQVALPILEAEKAGDFKSAPSDVQHKFWSAYGALNSKIKSAEEAKDYYRRFFYGILTALLLLQLYYSASLAVQARLIDVGKAIQAFDTQSTTTQIAKVLADHKEAVREQATYLHINEYIMGIPKRIASLLSILGLGDGAVAADDKPEAVARVQLDLATSFIGGFLLPVLYGMLGAIAFVLRRLSDESLTGEESREIRSRYSLRVPIGALSGLAAGWLLQPPTSSTMTSLSPFALAFVAGYSADLVFTAMDRLVAAFTSAPEPRKAERPSGDVSPQASDGSGTRQLPDSNADPSAATAAPTPEAAGPAPQQRSPRAPDIAALSSRAQANQQANQNV
ncbi:hypothetical protein [Bradyrhizobium sp. ORS 285]|uniref:hypothetical protein n=1 Tax=Bradyrhizobium sp. ORS 285 TaxID=115808 RepID=UPI0011129DAD|nr:hypothetical protein [Bradyrhizobium sp. ORS 285]